MKRQPERAQGSLPSIIDSPEKQQLARLVRVDLCRDDIRDGKEPALWEYIRLQWPDALFDEFQRDIIRSGTVGRHAEIAIKGCTGPGKGFAVATLVNVIFDVWPECIIVVTSSDIAQATQVMFGEIKAVRQRMRYANYAKIMTEEFKGMKPTGRMVKNRTSGQEEPEYIEDTKKYLLIANPKTGEGLSGKHGAFSVFISDESSAVPDEMIVNARRWSKLVVAISNPRFLSGWFYDLFEPAGDEKDKTQTVTCAAGLRRLVTIGGSDCRNVREKRLKSAVGPIGGIDIDGRHFAQGELIPQEFYEKVKPIIPSQTCYDQYQATMSSPDEFTRLVLGQGRFPKEDAVTQLFLKSWFRRHHEAWRDMEGQVPVEAFGLDLAATAQGDATVLAVGGPLGLRELISWKKANSVETIGWVIEVAQQKFGIDLKDGRVPIGIDNSGMGKTIVQSFQEMGVNVIEVSGQGAPQVHKDLYYNRRAEVYGELSRRMSPIETPMEPFALPECVELEQELCAHHKIPLGKGFKITQKDRYPGQTLVGHTVKEHIGRSPDRSDALCYLYAAVRTLESGIGAPVLDRPLMLITPEEQNEAEAASSTLNKKKTFEEEKNDDFNLRFPVLRAEGELPPVKELPGAPWPDFL